MSWRLFTGYVLLCAIVVFLLFSTCSSLPFFLFSDGVLGLIYQVLSPDVLFSIWMEFVEPERVLCLCIGLIKDVIGHWPVRLAGCSTLLNLKSWLPCKLKTYEKKYGHHFLSKDLQDKLWQRQWRQSVWPCSPKALMPELLQLITKQQRQASF